MASHIAQTDDGLYVLSLGEGWRILISTGSRDYLPGVFIISPQGVVKQAMTDSGITFDSNSAFYLGDPLNENSPYIVFDGQHGTIDIGGSGVNIHSGVTIGQDNRTLSQVLNDLDAAITSIEYGVGGSRVDYSDIEEWSVQSPE